MFTSNYSTMEDTIKASMDLLHVRGLVCSAIRNGDLSLVMTLLKTEEDAHTKFKTAVKGYTHEI